MRHARVLAVSALATAVVVAAAAFAQTTLTPLPDNGPINTASLEVDFSSIDFASRTSVLGAAKIFEDLGVAAYNGAGQFLESADFLLIAGKIVSVEARHAAAIRDLINPGSADFAGDDIIDANGLERTLNFTEVLTAASTYVKTAIDFSQLPS